MNKQIILFDQEDLDKIKTVLAHPKSIILLGHVSPDGDAVGSSLALSSILRKMGHTTNVIYPTAFPENLSFLEGADETLIAKDLLDKSIELLENADIIFCMDFNEPKRVEFLEKALIEAPALKILIDHHLHPHEFADITISYPIASSTCFLLFQLIKQLGWMEMMDKPIAEAIYTGMMTDTGGFSYNSEDPEIYTTLSELLEYGIEKDRIYDRINRSFSIDKIKLTAHLLNNNLTFFPQYRTAVLTVSMKEKQLYNYRVGDTEGLVNEALAAKGIDFSIFLHEMAKYTKVSLRSKGDFSCNEFANKFFNGGGHRNASGAEVYDSLGNVYKMVCEAIKIMHPKEEQ